MQPRQLPDRDPRVTDGALVCLRYAVFDGDDDLLDSGQLIYVQGQSNLLPAIEAALADLPVGATTEVQLLPESLRIVARVMDVGPPSRLHPGRARRRRPKVPAPHRHA